MERPQLYISIDGNPEFNISSEIPKLKFLGSDETPILSNNYSDANINDGSFFTTSQFGKNTVKLRFYLETIDYYEFKSLKQQIYSLFMQKRIFRVRTDAEPHLVEFLRPVGFDVKPMQDGWHSSVIEAEFENPSGYKFSRYDSLNQADLWDDYCFDWDIPILTKEDFHFRNQKDFKVFNPSGVPIDSYTERHDLKIHFKWSGDRITLTNRTNGSSFTFTENSNNDEIIVLNGCEFYNNGTQVNTKSDFGFIKLERGWNDIRVTGCESSDIKFEFPFIYV